MFIIDIETLAQKQDAVVLSMALLWFDETKKDYSYDELMESCCFVKFKAKDQIDKYGKKIDKETLDWWKKQCNYARQVSFNPSDTDLDVSAGIDIVVEYIKKHSKSNEDIIWARGSLDQMVFDSIVEAAGYTQPLFHYGRYRDIRTAVDLLKDTAKNGYCKVEHPGFISESVIKHDPRHDCCYDVMMLLYGI